jgi:hypothetical protein
MYIGWHCSGVIQKINAKTVLIKGWNTGSIMKIEIAYSKDFDLILNEANQIFKSLEVSQAVHV